MPRLLIYAFVAVLVVMWIRRLTVGRSRTGPKDPRMAKGMPRQLVCGACGKEYEPQSNGWLCPQCHR